MKKSLAVILISISLILTVGGIYLFRNRENTEKSSEKITAEQREKMVIGVLKTSNFTKKTVILGYDKDLNLIADMEYPYMNVGGFGNTTLIEDNAYFVHEEGHAYRNDGNKVLEFSLEDFGVKEHTIGKNALSKMAVNKKYIYGGNTVNAATKIYMTGRDGSKTKTVELPKEGLHCMFATDKNVFVNTVEFGFEKQGRKLSFLHIYDDELNHIKTIDLKHHTFDRYTKIGDKFYFSNMKYDETYNDDKVLYILDANTFEYETLELGIKMNLKDLIISGYYYILGSADYDTGGGITFKNIKTGEEIFHEMEYGPDRMIKYENSLYIFYRTTDHISKLVKYDINGIEITKVKEVDIKIDKVKSDNQFVTGVFPVK